MTFFKDNPKFIYCCGFDEYIDITAAYSKFCRSTKCSSCNLLTVRNVSEDVAETLSVVNGVYCVFLNESRI